MDSAALGNPENVALVKAQLQDDSSVLSEVVGEPASEAALAAMLKMRLEKRRLRKRADDEDGVAMTAKAEGEGNADIEGADIEK
jgi:hypothetical protein